MLPTIPDWIQAGAAVVQALSAAALVALTLLTLLVLRQYAADTGQIAKDSSSQVERSQRPFLALVEKPVTGATLNENWFLENQGFGPALNIQYTVYHPDGRSELHPNTPLAPGSDTRLSKFTAQHARSLGFRAEYESLSGRKYNTIVSVVQGSYHTKFVEGT